MVPISENKVSNFRTLETEKYEEFLTSRVVSLQIEDIIAYDGNDG